MTAAFDVCRKDAGGDWAMAANADKTTGVLGTSGLRFTVDGRPFPFTGISFFNAIYNEAFNASSSARRDWMRRFQKYGLNVLRIWGQWDNKRGFVDTASTHTLYAPDGSLNDAHVERLKQIAVDARECGIVIELAMFCQESWHDGIRLGAAADRAVANLTRTLQPYRNIALQVWNEFSERAIDHVENIKSIDPQRIVSNSCGFAGVLLAPEEGHQGTLEQKLDYLSPHTTRQDRGDGGLHWNVAPQEIAFLLARFRKPVVDDEPARNGTAEFGGPKNATSPYDHIVQIDRIWREGAHIIYHHDMFQTGAGSSAVPPSGIPDPEFSPYHRHVLEFVALRDRYFDLYREQH
jgi:hypothetical protein